LDLVRNREIASQEELLEKLLARKIDVSQSTLSRDIQELRLAKTGGVYAVVGTDTAPGSDDSVRHILREFLNEVAVAQNIVVLKTGVANASTVSLAIDNAGWPEVVGSLAGGRHGLCCGPHAERESGTETPHHGTSKVVAVHAVEPRPNPDNALSIVEQ
jgi:transcriptional regulator of arginine metabolism